jgi:hypothetical protein
VRLIQRRNRNRPKTGSDFEMTPPSLTPVLELPMRVEAAWLRTGRRLPLGLSLLAVFTN